MRERAARLLMPLLHRLGWSVLLPGLRRLAMMRRARLDPGSATVVTVNWNSAEHLRVLVSTVRRRSPTSTRILVVDNGSQQPLPTWPGVRVLRLPLNMGHDFALDLGVILCSTEFVVTLDVDAFPLHDEWLSELLGPLRTGAEVSGARLNRVYVHPCCWAMRTERFVRRRHSFRSRYEPRAPGRDASGDVGEVISAREAPALHFFDVASQRGPGDVGTVFGGLVYHNFYATRFHATQESTLDAHVAEADAREAWQEAVRRYAS
ncbi:MAG TPA: glycosyltransferase [Solirubrobacteraceae bacterium]|nr:glycosyltransferase [Solirubrobacteraceae bacterium]